MSGSRGMIIKASSVIMAVTILAKIVGFVREQVIAHQFGATGLTDAYVSAQAIPLLITSLIGGALSAALLPVFAGYLARKQEETGWQLAGTVLSLAFAGLTLITIIGIPAAPWIVRLWVPDMNPALQTTTVFLLQVMLPGIVFSSLSIIASILLNAHNRFAVPAFSPIVMNAIIIGSIFVLSKKYGIEGLAWGTVGGWLAQLLWLVPFLRKVGFRFYRIAWRDLKFDLGEVFSLAWPLFFATILTQLYVPVEKILGSRLDQGSISALNYALKLEQLPIAVFVTAVTTVVFPTLARHAADENPEALTSALFSGLRLMCLVTLPVTGAILVLRVPLVQLAFERGAFTHQATLMTAGALALYTLGMTATAGVQIFSRSFYALRDSRSPLLISLLAAISYFGLAYLLTPSMAHEGLALANAAGLWINALVLYGLLYARLKPAEHGSFLMFLLKGLAASGLMAAAMFAVMEGLGSRGILIQLCAASAVGGIVFAAAAYGLKLKEMRDLSALVLRRLGR